MHNERIQLACATGGFVAPALALLGLFGSGVMPPKPANSTAPEVAAFYAHHADLKMAGLLLATLAIGAVGPLVGVIGLQLLRIEERHPILAFTQLVAGAVTWVLLTMPLLVMLVTAYRPERSPELTQTLHDLSWILFLLGLAPFIVQNVCIAVAVLGDRGARPVFPRWLAWANLLIAASFVPDLLLPFFRSGAFSYQGVVAFWIPTVTYGVWLNLMALTTRRAVRDEARLERERASAASPPALAAA